MKKKNCCYVMKVQEIYDKTVKPFFYNELASKAKSFLKSRGLKKVAVTDEKSFKVLGVVRREKFIKLPLTLNNTILLKDLLEEDVFYASLENPTKEIIPKLLKYNEDCIPVVEDEKSLVYAGILTIEAILDAVTKLGSEKLNLPVKEVMKKDFPYVKSNDSLYNAWRKMDETKQSGLIVVNDENKVVGIITEHDLLSSKVSWLPLALNDDRGKNMLYISDLMNKHIHSLSEHVTVLEASKQMLKYRIGRMPVVDEDKKVLGIVDRRMLVELLYDAL